MGFALWIEKDVAWAEGTHEYRPMGVAVIAITDLFHARDFQFKRAPRADRDVNFAGYFASVGDLNDFLRSKRFGREPNGFGGVLSG